MSLSFQSFPPRGLYRVYSDCKLPQSQIRSTFYRKLLHLWEGQYDYAFCLTTNETHTHYQCCPKGTTLLPDQYQQIRTILREPQNVSKRFVLVIDQPGWIRSWLLECSKVMNLVILFGCYNSLLDSNEIVRDIFLQPCRPHIQNWIHHKYAFAQNVDFYPDQLTRNHFIIINLNPKYDSYPELYVHNPLRFLYDYHIKDQPSLEAAIFANSSLPKCLISIICDYLGILRCCDTCRADFRFQSILK
jgi:hypothetical protein